MRILCLYSNPCAIDLFDWVKQQGNETILCNEKLDLEWVKNNNFDLAVSYTYSYIIKKPIIEILRGNIVNLHTSYLPFCKGSYPNAFSIMSGEPRGVSIHYIDEGLDTGDIISQKIVRLEQEATLSSSYNQLDKEIKNLFKETFLYYPYWNSMRKKCVGNGSRHLAKELDDIIGSCSDWSWEMPIQDFLKIANNNTDPKAVEE